MTQMNVIEIEPNLKYMVNIYVSTTNGLNNSTIVTSLNGRYKCVINNIIYATSRPIYDSNIRTKISLVSRQLRLPYTSPPSIGIFSSMGHNYIQFMNKAELSSCQYWDLGVVEINGYIDIAFLRSDTLLQEVNFLYAGLEMTLEKINDTI
jgi:hypothetical protein